MKYVILGALLAILVLHPALAAAVLGFLGAAAVTVAAKPVVLAFAVGVAARPHLARRIPGRA
jgi:hypothetical protein